MTRAATIDRAMELHRSADVMGYQEIEHTADCGIRVWADDLATLFAEAARGLNMVSGAQMAGGPPVERRLELQADDLEGLLVAFLGELLYMQEDEALGFQSFDLQVTERRLTGKMLGGALSKVPRPLKAVTYHGLKIERSDSQYSCEVVFDA